MRRTTRPLREKTSVTFFAGSLHGCPATQTGVIGPRVTRPRSPLELVPVAAPADEATTAAARATKARISSQDRRARREANGAGLRPAPFVTALRRSLRSELA